MKAQFRMRVFRVLPLVCLAIAAGWGAIGLAQPRLISRNPALFEQNANDLERRSLERINLVRSEVGVPPLRWSEQLAESARAYGPKLAELGTFVHSPRAGRPNIGEALWMGPRGEYSIEAMIDYWAEEKRTFKPGIFPDVSTTGNWEDVSHYTQMIWRETREVGCALQRGGRSDYLICHFGPKGNRDGKQVP